MNTALCILLLVVAASAFPQTKIVPVVERTEVRDRRGQFTLEYLTGDGIKVVERGHLVPNDAGDGEVLLLDGSFSYTSPEGIPISVSYTSDQTGYHPEGDHIPKDHVL